MTRFFNSFIIKFAVRGLDLHKSIIIKVRNIKLEKKRIFELQ